MKFLFYLLLIYFLLNFHIFPKEIDISKLKEGDIIFQETKSEQGTAIKLATNSRYTHVGILFYTIRK